MSIVPPEAEHNNSEFLTSHSSWEFFNFLHQLVHQLLLRYFVKDFSFAENQSLTLAASDADICRRCLAGAVDGTAHHRYGDISSCSS